jgi:hypothetical protein
MAAYRRYSLLSLLILTAATALGIGWWSASNRWAEERQSLIDQLGKPLGKPSDHSIRNGPLTISCSEVGHYATAYSWHLSVNAAGLAVLQIEKPGSPVQSSFQLTDKQVREFREHLIRQDFFALDPDYGDIVPDGSTKTLTVVVGDDAKTVRVHYLMNMAQTYSYRGNLREAARALRAWKQVRNWFDHAEAVDSRQHVQRMLDLLNQ